MPNKCCWTTSKQHKWLEKQFPGYLQAQTTGKYNHFWPPFFEAWFEQFPAPELSWHEPTNSEHEANSDSEQTNGDDDTPASAQMTESPINTNTKSGGMRVEGRVTRPPKSTPTKRRSAAIM